MSKILEIDVCRACPYNIWIDGDNWHCSHQDRTTYKPNTKIPDWCSLPNATGEDDEKPNSNIIIGQDAVVGFSTDDRELGIVKEIKFKEMGGEDLLMIRVKTYVTKQNYWWDCNNVQLVALNLK